MIIILCFVFFLSGASALIFETLWFQLAGLSFGNSVWASTIVLSSFMGGLAFGNALATRYQQKIKYPVRFYAYLEITIAFSGAALVLVFPWLTELFTPVFQLFSDNQQIFNIIRLVAAFSLMLIPTSAMGLTLPVLVKAFSRVDSNFGRVLGRLYGWNTFGAVFGVLIVELFLIEWIGIRGSGFIAAGLNIVAAIIALYIFQKVQSKNKNNAIFEPPRQSANILSSTCLRILSASFLSGGIILALEVVWFRFFLLFFDALSLNFSLMLAVVLSGISLGGLAASKWFQHRAEAHEFLASLVLMNGFFVVATFVRFDFILDIITEMPSHEKIVFCAVFLMFPPSFVSGIIFTMLGKMLQQKIIQEGKATGLLILANTVGSMIGAFAAGFLLIPIIGIEKSIFLLALLYGAVAFLVIIGKQRHTLRITKLLNFATAAIFIIALVRFPVGILEQRILKIVQKSFTQRGEHLVAIREGMTETIQYMRKNLLNEPYYYRLVTNNHSMSSTDLIGMRYMKFYVYWPMAVHPDPENALLICFGIGSTARALTEADSLKHIDIVDISEDILEMSHIVFPNPADNPINDHRVDTHIEDGRFFLQTTPRKYDIITAEPPPPQFASMANLYSQEYFELIYNRLADGGIVTYWLPVYQLGIQEAKSILRGFCNVFEDCSLWTGAGLEWMMVGIKEPKGPVSREAFCRQWDNPRLSWTLQSLAFESPEKIGATFIADGIRLQEWIGEAPPLQDNYPKRLSSRTSNYWENMPYYLDFMNSEKARNNFETSALIRKLWPSSIRLATGPHFEVQQQINAILSFQYNVNLIAYLHANLKNPYVLNLIFWKLNSDYYLAGKIISEGDLSAPANDVLYLHLALLALIKEDFNKADLFFEKAQKFCEVTYHPFRIYLLLQQNNVDEAKNVARDFLIKAGKKNQKEVKSFLKWLFDLFGHHDAYVGYRTQLPS